MTDKNGDLNGRGVIVGLILAAILFYGFVHLFVMNGDESYCKKNPYSVNCHIDHDGNLSTHY